MTKQEVADMCGEMGIYFDRDHPDHISRKKLQGLPPPFMEYTITQVPWAADGMSDYLDIKELNIWIYSDTDVCRKEDSVRAVLDTEELRYKRTASYMEEVQMWAINYNMQI